jgi:hypothetical protein
MSASRREGSSTLGRPTLTIRPRIRATGVSAGSGSRIRASSLPAGVVSNEIVQHHDRLPTFLAAAGESGIVEKLKAGHAIGDTTYKVHIDG